MSSAYAVWRVLSLRHQALAAIAGSLFVVAVSLNAGFITAFLGLSEAMITPAQPPSQHYVVITAYSVTPFTSVIRESLVESRISRVNGVTAVVYELLAPVVVDGRPLILRGVNGRDLRVVAGDYRVAGYGFSDECIGCVWAGSQAAEELGLSPGDTIIAHSPLGSGDFVLTVEGILHTDSVLKHELVTNIPTAEAVRGSGPGSVSLAIVFTDSREGVREVAQAFNITPAVAGVLERAFLALRVVGPRVTPYIIESLPGMYLSRFGLSREAVAAAAVATAVATALGLFMLGNSIIAHDRVYLRIIWWLGIPWRKIRLLTAAITCSSMAIGALAGLAISASLASALGLSSFGYVIRPYPDIATYAVSVMAGEALLAAGVLTGPVGDGV